MSTRLTEEQKVIHFLNRTSFGPTREDSPESQPAGNPRLPGRAAPS